MRSSAHPANFQAQVLRSPEPTNSVRRPASIDRYGTRSGTVPTDFPQANPEARYSISYVPGMSEHVVNTGKTLPEAQLRVVLLSCEVERLNTMNYNLVKENEVLNARNKRSDREIDLENKLAIVLAENEKLNQIVEELHGVYARDRESLNNEDYERRISELLQDLEELKHKNSRLESQHPGAHDFKHSIDNLTNERELLREQLGRQGRDLEALRARLASIQVGPTDVKLLQEQISTLKIENGSLRSELDTMKLKYGNADALQERLHQYDSKLRVLLSENEKLNTLLVEQSRDLQAAQRELAGARNELLSQSQHAEERVKRAARPGQELTAQTNAVLEENSRLNHLLQEKLHEIEDLKARISSLELGTSQNASYREKLHLLTTENEKLNHIIHDLRAEIERTRLQAADATRVNALTAQINSLLDENRRLNDLVVERSSEVDRLRRRITDLESGSSQLAVLTSENEKLNHIIHDLRAEIERLRHQAGDTTKLNQLTAQIHGLLDENSRLNSLVAELKAENERLRHAAGDTTKLNQLTAQIHGLLDENKRLNDLVLERARENDRLRARIVELESGSTQLQELRGKLTLLAADNDRLNHIIQDLKVENDRLARLLSEAGSSVSRIEQLNVQINQLNSQLSGLTEENRRLNALILERAREIEQLRIQVHEGKAGSQQVAALAEENRRLASLLEEARNRYIALERDAGEVVHLRSRLNSLTSEIERLTAALGDRNRDLDEARRRHSELQHSLGQVDDLKSKLLLLTQENERLNNILVDKLRESDGMRVRISSLESSGVQIHSLEDRIHGLTGERDRLNGLLIERIREIDVLKHRINDLQASAHQADSLRSSQTFLATENERLNAIISERLREIDALRSRIAQLEGSGAQVGELKSQLELLIRENSRLNDALIDRSREVDTLKRRLAELEASSQNFLAIQNRISILTVENQGALQERDTLRAQLALVIAERDRLNILLSEKVGEVDNLRREQSRAFEASPSRSRESIKRSSVGVPDPAVEQLRRAYEETIQNLEQRIKLLDGEVGRLIGTLADRDHEVETWRQRSKEFEFTTQENARLNKLLTDRLREIEDLRREVPSPGLKRQESERSTLEAEYKRLLEAQLSEVSERHAEERQRFLQQIQELQAQLEVLTGDNQRLSTTVSQAQHDNEHWRSRYEQLERQRDNDIELLKQEHERRAVRESPKRAQAPTEAEEQNPELSEKVDFLNHEIERLQEHLNNTLRELEDWRKRYSELEVLRTQEIDALRHQFEDSKRLTIEVKEVSTKFNAERAAYEAQIGQLQQRVVDTEAQLRLIASENERVLRISTTRTAEAEESRRKYHDLKSSQSVEINQLRSQVETFKANVTDVKQLAIKYSADKAADQSQIKQLKQVNENYKTEIEKLYELIEQRKADFEAITTQNQELLGNFERLSEELREHNTTSGSRVEKLEFALREVEDLKASREEFKNQAERNSTELTRKNKDLIDRIQELDVLKLRYEESLANYHALNVKLFEKLSSEK